MFTNYFIYFNTLPKSQKFDQLFTILMFVFTLFAIGECLSYLKSKYLTIDKNSLWQRILKKL